MYNYNNINDYYNYKNNNYNKPIYTEDANSKKLYDPYNGFIKGNMFPNLYNSYKMEKPICNSLFYNKQSFLYPYFYTDDPDAVVTGYFLQDKVPAFTIKEQDGRSSMYCGTRLLTRDVFREIAKSAGCHISGGFFCHFSGMSTGKSKYVSG